MSDFSQASERDSLRQLCVTTHWIASGYAKIADDAEGIVEEAALFLS